jgi:hypothetical protein
MQSASWGIGPASRCKAALSVAWVMLLWWVVGQHKGMSRPKLGKVHVHVGTL